MVSDKSAKPAPGGSANEGIKDRSNYLRGNILDDLADSSTGSITEESAQLTKFHGIYMQDDRDQRRERRKKKLEKAFCFMIRVRLPGGVCTSSQWLAMDEICERHANGTLKITTRQAFQLHGVLKGNLKATIAGINHHLMDTLAACGDVNRNVMCNPNPHVSEVHEEVLKIASAVSDHLTPRTKAYHEIWLDGEKVAGGEEEEEPIYGKHYLPRKFKTSFAIPPSNDVDIYAQDLGFIAIVEDGELKGFNVSVGGGMGMAHNQPETYPQVAKIMGFCRPDQAVEVAEKVVLVQRDHGDRENRKHARLKYTIDDHGLDWFREKVEERLGYQMEAPRPFTFTDSGDRYGWVEGADGKLHYTLFILSGRVKDEGEWRLRSALRAIAKIHKGDFRLTANQNLVLGKVEPEHKALFEGIFREHGVDPENQHSGLRKNSMSCVALPTCGLALAESERYLPDLVTELESVMEEAGLRDDEILLRITGCPNGCARPYLGEIGLVGKIPGKYNLYLGAAFDGSRLNKLYRESVKITDLRAELEPIIKDYAKEREKGERFGDFVIRKGYIEATRDGRDFHENLKISE